MGGGWASAVTVSPGQVVGWLWCLLEAPLLSCCLGTGCCPSPDGEDLGRQCGVGRCPGATLLLVQARGLNVHSELCTCSARVFLESRGAEVSPSSWKQMEDCDFHQCRDCHTPCPVSVPSCISRLRLGRLLSEEPLGQAGPSRE